jgi:isocitrate dehydrogenase kinase/phosphatase
VSGAPPLPTDIARSILSGFDKHYRLFREKSATAKGRYERAEWALQREAVQTRIEMYDTRVAEAVAVLAERFPEAGKDDSLWPAIKHAYIGALYEHKQPECAETFFNSVARRVLDRRYYDNAYIFRRPAISTEHLDGAEPTYVCHYPASESSDDLGEVFRAALERFGLASPWQDLDRDLGHLMRAVKEHFSAGWQRHPNFQLQVLRSLFFRNKAAYVVGRVLNGNATVPFVVPLLQDEARRVYVDTVLLDPKEVGRLFSLGRAYFMVDMEVPSAYVDFLASLVPLKPRSELYTMVGLQKQGKTLFFRDLEQHIRHSSDKFIIAPGVKGMVMLVFTLPSFPFVFKLIRDWFQPPKDTDRAHVEERYDFVKRTDRVGRMTDTLEYAHVAFPKERFDDTLLAELERLARSCFEDSGAQIVIEHMYTERRLIPLDVYLAQSEGDEAKLKDGIREYGNAIKDLAHANLFPGDLLLKNFGVTRFGRVVFYDYDELTSVSELRFRTIPKPRDDADEMAAEPWYNVDPRDVFPEQFPTFLFPPGRQRDLFMELHGDLAEARYWIDQQERLKAHIQDDIFPYPEETRFCARYP